MGGSYSRPVVVSAPAGSTTYIPLSRHSSRTNITTVVESGAPTGAFVDYTLETINYDTATLAAANMQGRGADLVDPTAADWTATAAALPAGEGSLNAPVSALRAVVGGTGAVRIVIQQT